MGGVSASRLLTRNVALAMRHGVLIILIGDRCLKTNLAKPIGYGMIGVTFGLVVSAAIRPVIDWNMVPMLALVFAGGIIGTIIGMKTQSLDGRFAQSSDFPFAISKIRSFPKSTGSQYK